MRIRVSNGAGTGPTEIAAFDQALVKAGVANYNLIYLSSVLPPNSQVIIDKKPKQLSGTWGDRLYVVMAQNRTTQRNQEVWAGIGWIQDPKTKQGLLVEHEGHSEAEVRADIQHSLAALAANRHMEFGESQMHIAGIQCTDLPVCALVVAAFETSGWRSNKLPNFKLPLRNGRSERL
jgi:arginine decarboxylase